MKKLREARKSRKREQKKAEAKRAQTAPTVLKQQQEVSQGSMAGGDQGQDDISSPCKQPWRARARSKEEIMQKLQEKIVAQQKTHLLHLTKLEGWEAEGLAGKDIRIWPPGQKDYFRSYSSVIEHLDELPKEQQGADQQAGAELSMYAHREHACVISIVTIGDESSYHL